MRRGASVLMCAGAIGLAACGGAADRPSTATGDERAKARAAQTAAERNASDPAAWAAAIHAWITSATSGDRFDAATGEYTTEGEQDLRQAVAGWEKYAALGDADRERRSTVASRMVQTYVALDDLGQAAAAQEIVAEYRRNENAYAQLAILSYQAGHTRKGDLAASRSIKLAPRNRRRAIKGALEAAKKDAALVRGSLG